MPELPDIVLYIECLEPRIVGSTLERVRIRSPSLLKSVSPSLREAEGRSVRALHRLGKRIAIELDGELFVVVHLMIAGRLRWRARGAAIPGRIGLAAFDFSGGSLLLTEASSRKRASLWLVRGASELRSHDPGGIDVMETDLDRFREVLRRENHTLKRALTDPRLLSGIGNAYSDEILHRARLSPLKQTRGLSEEELARLHACMQATLREWTERLRAEVGAGFPEKVTAFREGMAVHGRYRHPCPDCGSPVQRIVYAETETHYCAACQTGGRLLADRALSRLLRSDWPRTLEELEARRGPRSGG